jgi:hypothetical protein
MIADAKVGGTFLCTADGELEILVFPKRQGFGSKVLQIGNHLHFGNLATIHILRRGLFL